MRKSVYTNEVERVSTKTGFARSAGTAAYPELWRGLGFSMPTFLWNRKGKTTQQMVMPRSIGAFALWQPGVTSVQGKYGGYHHHDGGANAYMSFETASVVPGLTPKTGIAISLWYRGTAGGYQQLFSKDVNGGVRLWQFRVNTGGKCEFIPFRGAAASSLASATTINDGKWHHLFGCWDGVDQFIFVDGKEDAHVAFAGPVNTQHTSLYIGRWASGADYLNGDVGQFAFWNTGVNGHQFADVLYNDPYALHRLARNQVVMSADTGGYIGHVQQIIMATPTPDVDVSPNVVITNPVSAVFTLLTPADVFAGTEVPIAAELTLTLGQETPTVDIISNETFAANPIAILMGLPETSYDPPPHIDSNEANPDEQALVFDMPIPIIDMGETVAPDELTMTLAEQDPVIPSTIAVLISGAVAMTATAVDPITGATSLEAILPLMTLEAESYGRYHTGDYPNYETSGFPLLTLEAEIIPGGVLTADTTLPLMTLDIRTGLRTEPVMPLMTLSATISSANNGDMIRPLPLMTLSASGQETGKGDFSRPLPLLELEIDLKNGLNGDFASELPLLTLVGIGINGSTAATLNKDLPLITLEATGYDDISGDLSKPLPLLTVEAFADSYVNRFI